MRTHDLRQALRMFRREPAFAMAAVLTLTLGIGANTALFAVVEAVLLRPLPFEEADRLVVLRHRDVETGLTKPDIAIGDFVDLRARQRSLESLAGLGGFQSTFFGEGEPIRVDGAVATPDALHALRLRPSLGRLLQVDDAREGAAPVVLVSHEFWRTHLGSDPRVLTRSIQLGTTRRMVVGVLPPGLRMPAMPRTDVVVPQALPAVAPAQRRSEWMYGIGRLRHGESLARAQAELAALSRQFEAEFPQQNRGSRYEMLALRDSLVGDTRRPLLLLLAAVGFVLLIACANVGNLLLARALGRQQELALRLALGASRRRLVMQMLTEGLALGLAGGVAGVVVAWRVAPALAALIPNASLVPGLEQVGISPGVLVFALAASVASGLLFSAIPCVRLSRIDSRALPGQRGGTMTPEARTTASGLVAVEIALAVVLLAGAGLTLRSFANLLAVDPGFTSDGVLTVQLVLPEGRYDGDEARRAFYARAFADIDALPDVTTVGAAMVTPLTGNNWSVPLQRVEHPVAPGERPPQVGWQLASEGYFRALRIALRAGRLFEAGDATGLPVVIVSEAVATRFFPGETPVGRRVSLGDMEAEIVGVVGNIRRASLTDEPRRRSLFSLRAREQPADDAVHPRERGSGGSASCRAGRGPPARAAGGAVRDAHHGAHRRGVGSRDQADHASPRRLRGDRVRARGDRRLRHDVVSRAAPHARTRRASGNWREPSRYYPPGASAGRRDRVPRPDDRDGCDVGHRPNVVVGAVPGVCLGSGNAGCRGRAARGGHSGGQLSAGT